MPKGIAVDASGNLFVTDSYFDGPYTIRKITPLGIVTTFAGGNEAQSMQIPHDDLGTRARFAGPTGLAFGNGRTLYVTDIVVGSFTGTKFHDGSSYVRKIAPDAMVTTVAGNHGYTSLPAGGELAQFTQSTGIAIDANDNIFVTDRFNDGNRIHKITPTGAVSTVPLEAPDLRALHGLAVDASGNLYATDVVNHTIGKISPSGSFTVYAGRAGESGHVNTP